MKHVVSALKEFICRYFRIFSLVWRDRHILQAPARTQDERAFLPAHLELIDRPASPTVHWTVRTIICFFAAAILWSFFGKLEIVAVAPGKIVADSRTKVVQPTEVASIRRILVRDGQSVKRGDPLIELDATNTKAELSQASQALIDHRLRALRLKALVVAVEDGKVPELKPVEDIPLERVRAEQELTVVQFQAFHAKCQSLRAAIAQRRAELRTTEAIIGPLSESAHISRARSEDYRRLLEGRFVGRHDYLLREQERIAADRELALQRNRLIEIRSALTSAEEELRVLVADFRQKALDDLLTAEQTISHLEPEVDKASQRDRLMTLRAPVDGTVQQLAVHTAGGVVTPAQQLLVVVPEEALEVEAAVLNKDIGFVCVGQSVTVKVESFPYTRYGYLTGLVISVSHDAVQDEQLGLVFPVRVKLHGESINVDGSVVQLSSGMAVAAEVRTGRRRIIDYLLSPLQRHVGESLRER